MDSFTGGFMKEEDVVVGAKIRCTNGIFNEDKELPFRMNEVSLPKKGVIYTIRGVERGYVGGIGILLEEIVNRQFRFDKGGLREPIFAVRRFKLV